MWPCNVIVQRLNDRQVEVATVNPVTSTAAVPKDVLMELAQQAEVLLEEATIAC